MFRLSRSGSASVFTALIDIGSGTIGIGIVAYNPIEKTSRLIYTHRVTLRLSDISGKTREQNLRRLSEALFSASLILSQEGSAALQTFDPIGRITQLHILCSSPWSHSLISRVIHTESEPFKITSDFLTELKQTTETNLFEDFRKQEGERPSEYDVIERASVDTHVNDYRTKHLIDMLGTSLSFTHILGILPHDILASIHDIHNKLFPHTEIRIHTTLFAMFYTVKELFSTTPSLTLINITGESSEIGIVEDGVLVQVSSFPYGSNTLLREIIDGSGKPESDVMTSLHAQSDSTAVVPTDFTAYTKLYRECLTKAFLEIFEKHGVPNNLVITTHKPFQTLIESTITNVYEKIFEKKPRQLTIHQHTVEEITGGSDGDIYLALATRFFHTMNQEHERNGED